MKKLALKTKNIWLLIGFIIISSLTMAQSSLTIEATQQYTSFKFTDSDGARLNSEYTGIFTGAYGVGYQYISEGGVLLRGGLGMRTTGASLILDEINYEWHLKYADVKLGGGYMLKNERFSPYLNVGGYYAYLIQATQLLNNETFDIRASGSIKETDYGIFATPGLHVMLSDAVSTFLEAKYLMGLQNIDPDNGQEGANESYGLTLGLSFTVQ